MTETNLELKPKRIEEPSETGYYAASRSPQECQNLDPPHPRAHYTSANCGIPGLSYKSYFCRDCASSWIEYERIR